MIIESIWIRGLGEYRTGEKKKENHDTHFVKAITESGQLGRFTLIEHNGAKSLVCGKTFTIRYKNAEKI